MRTYSFALVGARLVYLLTVTRVDGTIIRVTNYHKPLTIGAYTWYPEPGLEIGDYTESNNGSLPNMTFRVAYGTSFERDDVINRLFEQAEAVLYLTDARSPTLDDPEAAGILKGEATYDLQGRTQFEFLNKYAMPRDYFVRQYTIRDNVNFGDPRRSKIPTFTTLDPTSDDLSDVQRSSAVALGERRRFRYASAGNPSDYHNVYWENATGAGTTGSSAPVSPSDTPGATITDGSVTWTVRNAYARAFQVASIIDDTHITITVTEPRASGVTTWFAPGQIVMRSGYLNGIGELVDAWDGTSQIGLKKPIGGLIAVNDWGEIAPDYDQTLDMAVDKYGAALTTVAGGADGGANNFRGFPHLTGAKVGLSTYIPGVTVDSDPDADDPGAGSEGGEGGGGGGGYVISGVEFEDGSS